MSEANTNSEQPVATGTTEIVPDAVANLRQQGSFVADYFVAFGEITIVVPREHIVQASRYLKTAPGLEFDMLADLCGADRGIEADPRYEVNYHLFSTKKHHRIRLKVLLPESHPYVDSVTSVWRTANWHERETYDLVGVVFEGHPDLRRILMPDDTVGHPLRKDYPLRGYEPYSLT